MRPVIRGSGVMAVGGGGGDGTVQAPVGVHGHPAGLWTTPTPYLFLGFAVMMVLIAAALLVLVCTRRKPSSRRQGEDEEAAARAVAMAPLDREPKVVVIMAGERLPSFLASARPFAAPAAAMAEAA